MKLLRTIYKPIHLSFKSPFKIYSSISSSQQIQSNQFVFGSCIKPHPEKEFKGGEDAMFADKQLLAVMDGVGGWAEHGIDPALYSKKLATIIQTIWQSDRSAYIENPKQLIIESAQQNKEIGSTTCCVLTIDPQHNQIHASYIGDSGYMIFRNNDQNELCLIYEYEEHTHGFNFPFQIGSEGDHPNTALTKQHEVQDNDIIVVGTDGLFDNVSAQQIKDMMVQYQKNQSDQGQQFDCGQLATQIAEYSKRVSLMDSYMSPFAKRAIQQGYYFVGGKSDDITVIVAKVQINSK